MKVSRILILLFLFLNVSAQTGSGSISKGNEYYEQAQFELAERQYREALQKDKNNTTAQYNLANALVRQKKFAEAEQVLNNVTSATSDKELKANSFYNTGVLHTKQKNLEQSIEGYKNALRINPDDRQARENLQKALLELKQKQQQQDQQQKQKQQSSMSQNQANQKLQQLQEKERQIQERLQNQNAGKGSPMPKDW